MSADDGARLLWLDFGGEDGEIVSGICQKKKKKNWHYDKSVIHDKSTDHAHKPREW